MRRELLLECDFLNQKQGKLHVDNPLPIVFYACSLYHTMNICMYRIIILFCYIVELSPVIADRGSCSFAMLVDGVVHVFIELVRIIYIYK